MRDNFVCWEGEGGQMPINGNFTMKIVLFKFSKGEGGGRDLYPFNPPINIKSNQTEIF